MINFTFFCTIIFSSEIIVAPGDTIFSFASFMPSLSQVQYSMMVAHIFPIPKQRTGKRTITECSKNTVLYMYVCSCVRSLALYQDIVSSNNNNIFR